MKPTVTQLISLLDKPALMKWSNKIGLQGISLDEYRKNKMATGSDLHKQIEDHILNQVPFKEPETQKAWNKFADDKLILTCEEKIETEYFTGRIDLKMFYKTLVICDFKSHKGVYFENILQLTAYRMAKSSTKVPTRVGIIEIPEFKLNILDISDFTPYEEILKALYLVFTNRILVDKSYRY